MKGFALTHLLLIFLSDDYSKTVIGRTKRDYVWIMAREPEIADKEYTSIVNFLQKEGYDVNNLQRLQHSKRQETQ